MSLFDRLLQAFSSPPEAPRAVYRLPGEAGRVLDALRGVVDPELGRDVVALGMVRAVEVVEGRAHIDLCPTTAGCPLGDWLSAACRDAAAAIGLPAEVRLVDDPPWSPSDIEGGPV